LSIGGLYLTDFSRERTNGCPHGHALEKTPRRRMEVGSSALRHRRVAFFMLVGFM
jgi:hypothetical protein